MKPFPKIHDVYVAKAVIGTILLTWMVLLGLDVMLALVNEISDIGKGDYGFGKAVAHVAYTAPRRAYTLFPTSAVIGALMGLGQLAASSELTALRALGLSRRRLGITVAGAVALLTLLTNRDTVVARYSGLWAREGEVILNAQGGQERSDGTSTWLELRDVSLYEFEPDGRLKSISRAAVAEHRPGSWLLRNVTRTLFEGNAVRRESLPEQKWASRLDTAALTADLDSPRYLPSDELRKAMEYRERNGLDANEFEEHYWGRWFYPINALALCLAAVPFAFGTLRSGGLGRRLFIGIVFALGFWLVQIVFVRAARAFQLDYRVAYVAPTLLMLVLSTVLFRRRSG